MARKTPRMTAAEAHHAILDGRCPEGAEVDGDLHFHFKPSLAELPKGLKVRGHLAISGIHRLERLPEGLEADSLVVSNCASLAGFAESCRSFRTPGDLTLSGCPLLQAFPERLEVGGDLWLEACHRAWSASAGVPDSLNVAGSATLEGCAGLELLPADTRVGHWLKALGCARLLRLPERLSAGALVILDCAAFEGFDKDCRDRAFHVRGNLDFSHCPSLRLFPGELSVGGHFWMRHCARAWNRECGSHPPDSLRVGRWASIDACAGLTALPARIKVGEALSLSACHGLEAVGLPPAPGHGRLEVRLGFQIRGCQGVRRIDDVAFTSAGRLEVLDCHLLEAIGTLSGTLSEGWVTNCPGLSQLPGRLALEGDLELRDCPLLVHEVAVEGRGRVVREGSTPAQPAAPAPGRGARPLTPANAPKARAQSARACFNRATEPAGRPPWPARPPE